MSKLESFARAPRTPLFGKYSAVHAQITRMRLRTYGAAERELADAAGHVVAASVCSEDGDLVGVKANLAQAFALVAPHCFELGAA